MTTIALAEKYTLGGVDLSTLANVAMAPGDVNELPQLRGDDAALTGLHGRQYLAKLFDARQFQLLITVLGQDASGAVSTTSRRVARDNLDALLTVLGRRTQQTMSRVMPDSSTRTALVECLSVANFGIGPHHELFRLVATFRMTDPFWYGASSTGPGSQSTASSPKDFTFTATGVAASRKLTIDFTGPITNPRITNQTTGAYVDVDAVVASTKHLIINPYAFTVTNDGVDVIGALTHGETVEWLRLEPGANSLRVTADTPGGSVLVTAYPAFF